MSRINGMQLKRATCSQRASRIAFRDNHPRCLGRKARKQKAEAATVTSRTHLHTIVLQHQVGETLEAHHFFRQLSGARKGEGGWNDVGQWVGKPPKAESESTVNDAFADTR
jgi:hypothetical protein